MLRRYLRLMGVRLRASSLLAMQYRADFIVDGIISVFWMITALVPLFVVFQNAGRDIEGWSFGESLLVIGWFTLLQGVLEGAINPSLTGVVEHIRKGTLDFVLLKPADAQFLVSTERFLPWRATNAVAALAIFGYAFHLLGRGPSLVGLGISFVLLGTSVLLLYSLWILTVCAAFYVVKVDNLGYFFTSLFDAARWPAPVFRGALSFVFTFIIPLGVMTTFPAEAMLGRLPWSSLGWAILGSCLFAFVSRRLWKRAIGRYTSASS
ncbi:ABC transporter permease [Melittangium boletus]|uniref:Multidrug efflux membrane protein n=1 Tax=Melittangium boletus DSM 14713 TaxID=1294270 RepID=A0A250IAS9_9BACT|nr:ABC-2 family transporter protein [Melittangium boletus]ATB28308.1 multidrug efflux membrane protein [Melittangium boletus DSM 14713]